MSNPSSAFRKSYLYVESRTRRRLHLVASVVLVEGRTITADEHGDRMINETIESKYPAVIKLEKEIHKLEKELADELQKGESK